MKSVNLFWSAIIWNEGRKEKRHINTSAGNKCRKKVLIHLPFTEETWVPCPNDRSGGESCTGYLDLLNKIYKIQ